MTSILTDIDKNVATVTLNRPDVLNALSPGMARELHEALLGVSKNKDVRCVVLKGAGEGFMAGGDIGFFKSALADLQAGKLEDLDPILGHVHGISDALRDMPMPVIGALHGAVAGFGVSLVAACDLTVAADDTRFSLAYCHLGASPDGASTYILPRIVGIKKALELALLGDPFDAREAHALGLLNKVVPADDRDAVVGEWVNRFLAGPRFAYGKTKALMYGSLDRTYQQQIELEEESFKACAQTADFAEGVTAFVEKRKAKFA